MPSMARILPPLAESISTAAHMISAGAVVAVPTDTVYGLACDPFSEGAVDRLFEVKGREAKAVPVLCNDIRSAERFVRLDGLALELAVRFWPGALTIVAPLMAEVPARLHQQTGWLGVRVPDRRECLLLAEAAGGGITGTSANLSGRPSCRSAEEVLEQLGDRVDAVLDGGRTLGKESTVVKVLGETVEVLRKGAIGIPPGSLGGLKK